VKSAVETEPIGTQNWAQAYNYDGFGNMWSSTTGLNLNNNRQTSNVYNANNQIGGGPRLRTTRRLL
jgi:nitrous oxidase accessory protein NosD